MKTRKQKALFRKTLNKIYPHAIFCLNNGTFVNGSLYEFRRKCKTFKLGIRPIKKKNKQAA